MPALSALKLPYDGLEIQQDSQSQRASHASQMLIDCALAAFPENSPISVLELGSGSGVISIMCALARPLWQITGIEIQPHLHSLALENAATCNIPVKFHLKDLREFEGKYDLILGNPPWQKTGSGRLSPLGSRNLSRIELGCSMADILACVKRCLAPGGSALLLYPKTRKADIIRQSRKDFRLTIQEIPQNNRKQYFCAFLGRKPPNEIPF